mmetsp:Transcript_37408/g.89616  ORF Transcript_37408/g.89616 Transcript_37408/m.89616 type:complete len:653 (-) Transcript_37408:34-1992(-)
MECKRRKTQGLYWGGPEQRLPTISNWRFDENGGTVSGTVANLWACDAHPKELSTQKGELGAIQEGSQFTTPPVIDPCAVNHYSLIQTESGSWYRLLGEDKPPRISNWRFDKNRGTVSGTVIGDQAIRDGSPFTTSRLKDPSAASQFAIVETESGSEYELLNAADAPWRSTSNTEKQCFDYLDQHPNLLEEISWYGFGGTWESYQAAQREADRLPIHINSDHLLAAAVRIRTDARLKRNAKEPIRFVRIEKDPAFAYGRLSKKYAGKFELLHHEEYKEETYWHDDNKLIEGLDYVTTWDGTEYLSRRKCPGYWPGRSLGQTEFYEETREVRSNSDQSFGRCFIIEGVFFLWPMDPKGFLCPRRPYNKWHLQGMYTKGEALCYILSLPKKSSQRGILMKFFVQNRLVPVLIKQLYKLVSDYELGTPIRGDDWDSNDGPPFQILNTGIPSSILNSDSACNIINSAPKPRQKKVIRGFAKLNGQKGWKANLFFPVNPVWESDLSENPIIYDVAWYKKYPKRGVERLGFPRERGGRHSFRRSSYAVFTNLVDVCELFQNEKKIARAYFKGFVPPGYGNKYSYDKVKEYIICQSISCGSPLSCVETKELKSGTQKLFRCTKVCADGKKCPFGFVLGSDFRGYYIDCHSRCCKWHICDD